MTIAVITDSSGQLSSAEAQAAGIAVVPIGISVDDRPYLDGVDLSPDEFYALIGEGVTLATSQPSPGAFIEAWKAAVCRGATEIVSVHVGQELSATLNSARLAATEFDVPILLIDSKSTSYGLGILALEIANRIGVTSSTDGLEAFASTLVAGTRTAFILQDLRYIMKGGRMRPANLPTGERDIPVLAGAGGGYQLVGTGTTVVELVDRLTESLLEGPHQRHAAVAYAAPDTLEFTERLEVELTASSKVETVRRYRMGPAIAVHTGPGTAGGFTWPVEVDVDGECVRLL